MTEKTSGDIYLAYLDQILAGEKDIGPVEDVEIVKLLVLAKSLIAADFSANSKIRANLRQQILDQVSKNNKSSLTVLSGNDDELDEEALDYVAGGVEGQQDICPHCGSRSIKSKGKCPICNH